MGCVTDMKIDEASNLSLSQNSEPVMVSLLFVGRFAGRFHDRDS